MQAADRLLTAGASPESLSLRAVAREAGVAAPSVYLHFESKAEVALSTIDRLVSRVVERLAEIAASDLPAGEKVVAMLRDRVLIRFDAVRGYSSSLDELLAAVRAALLERRKQWFAREARVIARVLASAGDGVVAHPAEAARDLLAATNAFLPYSLTPRELGRRAELEAQVVRIATLLVRGLGIPTP
ncbi:MAG: TetR family transcriptional regulator [Thermomicrobiales bacterium]|nr:TetR family transcriptional regulator [Thermomicrobiales bacterium]